MAIENPFAVTREARSKTLTVRLTPTEHEAIKTVADQEKVDIGDLVREGLGMVIDKRNAAHQRGRR